MSENGLSVSPVSDWQLRTVRVRLPSGHVADLRVTFPVYMLLRTGKINGELLNAFTQAQAGALNDPKLAIELTDVILGVMFVSPKVGKGGLDPNLLTDEDVEFVLERAFGGTPDPGFRGDTDGAGGGADGEGVRAASVESAGDGPGVARKPRARSKPRSKGGATTGAT